MAFPFTSNLNFALASGVMEVGIGAGGGVNEVASPLLKVIWGRTRLVRSSRSFVSSAERVLGVVLNDLYVFPGLVWLVIGEIFPRPYLCRIQHSHKLLLYMIAYE